jgi:N-acyl-D-amino-acid deacylase
VLAVALLAPSFLSAQRAAAAAPVTGDLGAGLEAFDRIALEILERHEVPGIGLAVAKNGRLVIARGYGLADREKAAPVEPTTRFALASISKAITAVSILALVEEGKLALDDPAVQRIPDVMQKRGLRIRDERLKAVTIRELLDHSSGFPRAAAKSGCAKGGEVIPLLACMLGTNLVTPPGARTVYSNFAYMFLGEIVREAAGAPDYATAVRSITLAPMGLAGVEVEAQAPAYLPGQTIGYAARSGRRLPGGGPPSRAAAGGWVASPLSMVRFLMALDGSSKKPFLSKPMLDAMLARPKPSLVRKNGTWFGLGWDVVRMGPAGATYSKNGGLDGTATIFEHAAPDVDWAVFLNSGGGNIDPDRVARRAIADAIRAEIARRTTWPDVDYWSHYPTP